MKKRLIAIVLCLVLCAALFAGCGNSEQVAPSGDSGSAASSGSASSGSASSGGSESAGGEAAPVDFDEDPAEINIALMAFAPMDQSATAPVVDAINELTLRDINVHVNINWYDAASYGTQVPMQIQGGEKLDIIMFTPVPGASYTSYRSANQLMDISGYLQDYGQTILSTLGDLVRGTAYGDAIYGITNYNSLTGHETMFIRKDLADAAGVTEDLENAKTWDDFHDAFMAITAQTGMPAVVNTDAQGTVLYPRPFVNADNDLSKSYWYDNLGDGYNLIMTDPDTNTVLNYYATDDFKQMCERIHNWYQDGLVYKDAATAQEYADTLIKSGVGYANIRAAELGTKESSEAMTGYEFIAIELAPSMIGTSSCTKFGYAVPVTSTEPEAAVRYLNYLYENPDVLNILTWGVPGRDWTVNADGLATYPDGVTADSVAYHTGDFLYGSQLKTIAWEGGDVDIRAQQQKEMDDAEVSKYMGFALNTDGLENTITACKTVCDRYVPTLGAGSVADWEGAVEKLNADLSAAGMDDLIAAYQAQLDAWLADNG